MIDSILKYKTWIIAIALLVLAFFLYNQFFPKFSATGGSGLVQTQGGGAAGQTAPDAGFITQLLTIQNITIDTSLFNNAAFNNLVDSSKPLPDQTYGRLNPFAPFASSIVTVSSTSSAKSSFSQNTGSSTSKK